MMKWGMEILSPTSYNSNSNWLLGENRSTRWTHEENKLFENALAVHDKDTPDRWHKVAAMIPGKSVGDVMKQYKELEDDVSDIEAGLIPIPGYTTSSFTLEWVNNQAGLNGGGGGGGRRSLSGRPSDQERKKGVPWTEDEHRLFLMGLKRYGKGDWRNISRNFVVSRTPTQVASHAQKYFIRQLSGGKDKRRSSIHDITTVCLSDTTPSPDRNRPPSPDPSTILQHHPNPAGTPKAQFEWNQPRNGTGMVFNPTHANNLFMSSSYGTTMTPYGLKFQGQNQHRGAIHGSHHIGSNNMVFQMQSTQHHPHG